jgi:hypothetical protein
MKAPEKLKASLRDAGATLLDPASLGKLDDGEGCGYQIGGLRVLASWSGGWDHVSVSAGWGAKGATRVPSYAELESVRRMFWEAHETVVQIHPPLGKYVNFHPYVLHLWRSQAVDYPLPPQDFIA